MEAVFVASRIPSGENRLSVSSCDGMKISRAGTVGRMALQGCQSNRPWESALFTFRGRSQLEADMRGMLD